MKTPKKKPPPKLSRATVDALDAMRRALPELEGVMPPDQFAMLHAGLRYAEAEVEDALRRGASFSKRRLEPDRMEARWAFETYCWVDPPPEGEKHFTSRRKAKSDWAKRYVAWMTAPRGFDPQARVSGFNERQAFEAFEVSMQPTREREKAEKAERDARLKREHDTWVLTVASRRPGRGGPGR